MADYRASGAVFYDVSRQPYSVPERSAEADEAILWLRKLTEPNKMPAVRRYATVLLQMLGEDDG